MSGDETGAAMAMLPALIENPLHEAAPRRELWRYGISGDLPLICCEGRAQEAEPLLRQFCLLKSCGVDADLVYLSPEHGEYQQPLLRRMERLLAEYSLEALIGARGGVHFAPLDALGTISSRAAVMIGLLREYWGLGIGSALFREMEREAREHGTAQLELEMIEGNDRALALYRSAGFEPMAEHPDAFRLRDGTSRAAVFMRKVLK